MTLAFPLLLAACLGAPPDPDPVGEPETPMAEPLLDRADLVFEGSPTKLGQAPGAWSGTYAIHQTVTWQVDTVFRGEAPEVIEVRHLVVKGSTTAAETPELSSAFFAPDRKLVVFARKTAKGFEALNANDAVRPADDALRAALTE